LLIFIIVNVFFFQINTFKLVGGNTARLMVRNILKKAVTNSFAQHFSWAGKKTKRTFQDLGLTRLIIRKLFLHIYIGCIW